MNHMWKLVEKDLPGKWVRCIHCGIEQRFILDPPHSTIPLVCDGPYLGAAHLWGTL